MWGSSPELERDQLMVLNFDRRAASPAICRASRGIASAATTRWKASICVNRCFSRVLGVDRTLIARSVGRPADADRGGGQMPVREGGVERQRGGRLVVEGEEVVKVHRRGGVGAQFESADGPGVVLRGES